MITFRRSTGRTSTRRALLGDAASCPAGCGATHHARDAAGAALVRRQFDLDGPAAGGTWRSPGLRIATDQELPGSSRCSQSMRRQDLESLASIRKTNVAG